jgi:hypothetical protein
MHFLFLLALPLLLLAALSLLLLAPLLRATAARYSVSFHASASADCCSNASKHTCAVLVPVCSKHYCTSATKLNHYFMMYTHTHYRSCWTWHAWQAQSSPAEACSGSHACSTVAAVSLQRCTCSCQGCCYQAGCSQALCCSAHTGCCKVSFLNSK